MILVKKENKKEPTKTKEPEFGVNDLLQSNQFSLIEKDFMPALLGNKTYTLAQAKAELSKKMKKEVK